MSFANDLRYAVRLLARSPVFTVTSVLSLAIGIAAATTIFGLADALLLQVGPGIRNGGRVVDIERTTNGTGHGTISYPFFLYLREHTRTLASITASTNEPMPLSMQEGTTTERVFSAPVSATFFDVLQARPALGRFFSADEDRAAGARPVAVLSHRLWRERFQSDPRVLDRSIRLNNIPFTIVGVAERDFEGPLILGNDVWVPMAMIEALRGPGGDAMLTDAGNTWHRAIGRLKPGATGPAAQVELNALLTAFRAVTPIVPASHGIRVSPGGRLPPTARTSFATFIAVLFALTAGLLAIACSNVAGMLLARATARRREMATRLAVGASRGRLIGLMLVEILLLFGTAAIVAVPMTTWLVGALRAFLPVLPMPIHFDVPITARTLLFAAGSALATGVVFGLAPARHALRTDLFQLLQGQSSTPGRDRLRLRNGLVIAQLALSLAIVIVSGLFVRSLQAASRVDIGFQTANVDIVSLDTTLAGAEGPRAVAMMERVVGRVRAVPGVEMAGHARMVPPQGGGFALGGIRVPGLGAEEQGALARSGWDVVSPGYFQTIGLPVVQGRSFGEGDRQGAALVAIVNETFAKIAWPGQRAVGQHFFQVSGRERTERPLEVVGVVKDAKYKYVEDGARTAVYLPFAQQPQARVELFVKHAPGQVVAQDVRAAIAGAEPGLPVVVIQSFEAAAAIGLLGQRVGAWVAGFVGVIGMFLAALGASRGDVRSMVLGQTFRLGVAGASLGMVAAWLLGRLIQTQNLLVDVPAGDPLTFGTLTVLMIAVLFAASYAPARRAVATDPAAALRAQ